jgi:hypothetical protein
MDKELLNTVTSYISSSLEGQDVENSKIDFKRQWYKLNEEPGKYQFLKDTSAIANTVGLDGFIIIGFDEKTKEFFDTTFNDSGLRDSEQIPAIINSHIDKIYDTNHFDITFDSHKLSVLHIPPSLEKPHVIRGYKTFDKGIEKSVEQHRVFVKRGTSTGYATKNDLELMYYDRKNLIPEYKIITNIHYPSLSYRMSLAQIVNENVCRGIQFEILLTFENNGRRPVAIIELELVLTEYRDPGSHELLNLNTSNIYKLNPLIIHPNEIVTERITFECSSFYDLKYADAKRNVDKILNGKRHLETNIIHLKLANQVVLKSELVKI